jgi:hypothetical protein
VVSDALVGSLHEEVHLSRVLEHVSISSLAVSNTEVISSLHPGFIVIERPDA